MSSTEAQAFGTTTALFRAGFGGIVSAYLSVAHNVRQYSVTACNRRCGTITQPKSRVAQFEGLCLLRRQFKAGKPLALGLIETLSLLITGQAADRRREAQCYKEAHLKKFRLQTPSSRQDWYTAVVRALLSHYLLCCYYMSRT